MRKIIKANNNTPGDDTIQNSIQEMSKSSKGRTFRRRQRRLLELAENASEKSHEEWLPALLKEMHKLGWKNPLHLSVRFFKHIGRGLCSKTNSVAVGDEIISIPFECLISIVTIEKDAQFKNILNQELMFTTSNAMCMQSWLAFYLLFQVHRQKNAYMRSYLASLPVTFDVPYFCQMNEIELFPDSIKNYIKQQDILIHESFDKMRKFIANQRCTCCSSHLWDLFQFKEFQWAWFIVNTRSVYVDITANAECCLSNRQSMKLVLSDKPNMALAPFLDLFNHSPKIRNKASMVKDEKGGFSLVLKMTGNHNCPPLLRAYEQLFISYGELTDFRLLLEYGMVLPENEHNFYIVQKSYLERFTNQYFFPTDSSFRYKFAFLDKHGVTENLFLHNHENGLSHNLHIAFNLLFYVKNNDVHKYNSAVYGDSSKLPNCAHIFRKFLAFLAAEYKYIVETLSALHFSSRQCILVAEYLKKCIEFFEVIDRKYLPTSVK